MGLRRNVCVSNAPGLDRFRGFHHHVVFSALVFVLIPELLRNAGAVKIGVMHYGSYTRMGITCELDELILISSEVLGYSTDPECNPSPMCSVPYTLAKWYCRGKSTCSGIPVERRPLHKRTCGSDFTNCLRVEYQCVKRQNLVNICEDRVVESSRQGFITSPSFPGMYSPNRNCTCFIQSNEGTPAQLKSIFFLLKANQPCLDYVGVKTDKKYWGKTCGYNFKENIYRGQTIQLDFISDAKSQEMGFWMEYKGTGASGVSIKCGPTAQMVTNQRGQHGMTTVLDFYKWHKKKMNENQAKQGLERRTGRKIFLRNGRHGSPKTQMVSFGDNRIDSHDGGKFMHSNERDIGDETDAELATTTQSVFIREPKEDTNGKFNRRNKKIPKDNTSIYFKNLNSNIFIPEDSEHEQNLREKLFTDNSAGRIESRESPDVITIQGNYKIASSEENLLLSNIMQSNSYLRENVFNNRPSKPQTNADMFSKEGPEVGDSVLGFVSSTNKKNGAMKYRKFVPAEYPRKTAQRNRSNRRYRIYDPKTGEFGWKFRSQKYQRAKYPKHQSKQQVDNLKDIHVKTGMLKASRSLVVEENALNLKKDKQTTSSELLKNENFTRINLSSEVTNNTVQKDKELIVKNNTIHSLLLDATKDDLMQHSTEDTVLRNNISDHGYKTLAEQFNNTLTFQHRDNLSDIHQLVAQPTTPASLLKESPFTNLATSNIFRSSTIKSPSSIPDTHEAINLIQNIKQNVQQTLTNNPLIYEERDDKSGISHFDNSFLDAQFDGSKYIENSIRYEPDEEFQTAINVSSLINTTTSYNPKQSNHITTKSEDLNSTFLIQETQPDFNYIGSSDNMNELYGDFANPNEIENSDDVDHFYEVYPSSTGRTETVAEESNLQETTTATNIEHTTGTNVIHASSQRHSSDVNNLKANLKENVRNYKEQSLNSALRNSKDRVVEVLHMANTYAILDDLPTAVITEKPSETLKDIDETSMVMNITFTNDTKSNITTNDDIDLKRHPSNPLPVDTTEIINQQNLLHGGSNKHKITTLSEVNDVSSTKYFLKNTNDTNPDKYGSDYLTNDDSYYLSTEGMISSSTEIHDDDLMKEVQSDVNENTHNQHNLNKEDSKQIGAGKVKLNEGRMKLRKENRHDMKSELSYHELFTAINDQSNSILHASNTNKSILYEYFNNPHKTWQERYNTWATYYYNLYKFNHDKQNNLTKGMTTPSHIPVRQIDSSTNSFMGTKNQSKASGHTNEPDPLKETLPVSTMSSQLDLPKDLQNIMPETTTPYLFQIQQKTLNFKHNIMDSKTEYSRHETLIDTSIENNNNALNKNTTRDQRTTLPNASEFNMAMAEKQGMDGIQGQERQETGSVQISYSPANNHTNNISNELNNRHEIKTQNNKPKNTVSIQDSDTNENKIIVDIAQNKQFSKIIKAMQTEAIEYRSTTASVVTSIPGMDTTTMHGGNSVSPATPPPFENLQHPILKLYTLPDISYNTETIIFEKHINEVNNERSDVSYDALLKPAMNNSIEFSKSSPSENEGLGLMTPSNPTLQKLSHANSEVLSNDDTVIYSDLKASKYLYSEMNKSSGHKILENSTGFITNKTEMDGINEINETRTFTTEIGITLGNTTENATSYDLPLESSNGTDLDGNIYILQSVNLINNTIEEKQATENDSLFINDEGLDNMTGLVQTLNQTDTLHHVAVNNSDILPEDTNEFKNTETSNKVIHNKSDNILENTNERITNANEYDHQHWWNQYWQQKWQETWERYHRKHDLPKNTTSKLEPFQKVWEPSPEEFLKQDFDYQKPIIPSYLGQKDPDNIEAESKDEQIARWNKVYGKWFLLDSKQPIEDFVKVINEKWKDKQKSFIDNELEENKLYSLESFEDGMNGNAENAFDYLVSQSGTIGDYYKWGFHPNYDYQGPVLNYNNQLQNQDSYTNQAQIDSPLYNGHYKNIVNGYKEANFHPSESQHAFMEAAKDGLLSEKIGDGVTVWDARFVQNEHPLPNEENDPQWKHDINSFRVGKDILEISDNKKLRLNVLQPKDNFISAPEISNGGSFEINDSHMKNSFNAWDLRLTEGAATNKSESFRDNYKEPWDGRSFIWNGQEPSELSYDMHPVNQEFAKETHPESQMYDYMTIEDQTIENSPEEVHSNKFQFRKETNENEFKPAGQSEITNTKNRNGYSLNDPWDIRLIQEKNVVPLEENEISTTAEVKKQNGHGRKANPIVYNMEPSEQDKHDNKMFRTDRPHDSESRHVVPMDEHLGEIDYLREGNKNERILVETEILPWDVRLSNQKYRNSVSVEIPIERQDGNLYKHIYEPIETSTDEQHFNIIDDFHDMDWNTNGRNKYENFKELKEEIQPKNRQWWAKNWNKEALSNTLNNQYKSDMGKSIDELGQFNKHNDINYQPINENFPDLFNDNHQVDNSKPSHPFDPFQNDAHTIRESHSDLMPQIELSQEFSKRNNHDPKSQPKYTNKVHFRNNLDISETTRQIPYVNYKDVPHENNLNELKYKGKVDKNRFHVGTNDMLDERKGISKTHQEYDLRREPNLANSDQFQFDSWNTNTDEYEQNILRNEWDQNYQIRSKKQPVTGPDKKLRHIQDVVTQDMIHTIKKSKTVSTFPKLKDTAKAINQPRFIDENPSSWPDKLQFSDQSTERNTWLGKPKRQNEYRNPFHPNRHIKTAHENDAFPKDIAHKSENKFIPQKNGNKIGNFKPTNHETVEIPKSHRWWEKDRVTLPQHRRNDNHVQPVPRNTQIKHEVTGLRRNKNKGQPSHHYNRLRVTQPTNSHPMTSNRTRQANSAWKHAKSVRADQMNNHIPTMARDPSRQYTRVLPHNMQQNPTNTDPTLYGRLQNYLDNQAYNKNLLVPGSKMAAIESQPEPTKGVNKDTVWVLLVIAIIGWLIFMVMVGLLVYYKRHRMCNSKVFRSRHGYSSSYASSMPKHLLFPDLHSPLCTFSHPQGDLPSSHGSPSIPTRPHSANSNDSLLGIPQYNPQSDPRPRKKKNKQSTAAGHHHHHTKQMNKSQMQINDETFSTHSAFSNGAMSDRPLPPVPLSPPLGLELQNRTRSSSMCAEMAFSSNSSTESIGVQEIMGHCDMPGFDKKSIASRIMPTSDKSHYQSLNTIRDRKAKNRCPGRDPNMFSQPEQVDIPEAKHRQTSHINKANVSSNVNNWVVQNMPPRGGFNVSNPNTNNGDVKYNVRPGTPVIRQKQRPNQIPSNFSTFMPVETHATPYPEPDESAITTTNPIKDKNPTYTNIQEMNDSASEVFKTSSSSSLIPQIQSSSRESLSHATMSDGPTSSNSDTEHSVTTIPHQYAQASTPFNERRPSPSASAIGSPEGKKRAESSEQQYDSQNMTASSKAAPPAKPQRNPGSRSIRSVTTMGSTHSSECTEAIYMSLNKIANKYADTSQNGLISTPAHTSDTFDKNSLISQLDQVSSKNSLISQKGKVSTKKLSISQIDEAPSNNSSLSEIDPVSAKNSLMNHIEQVTANFKPFNAAAAKEELPAPVWSDLYQNGQVIKENSSLMSSESMSSVEQEPTSSSTLTINAENSQNSSMVSRTIRSPSNDQVFLKTAPHMVTDGNPYSKDDCAATELPCQIPFKMGPSASPMSSHIATSSAAVSEITLPSQPKFPETLSPNPILMGSQALKSATSLLPTTFAAASAAYPPASRPPIPPSSVNQVPRPQLGLLGLHHPRTNGPGGLEDARIPLHRQHHQPSVTAGMQYSKPTERGGKASANNRSQSQLNANAQRIITTLSNTKPGSSAERIKKIIPEQASLFNEIVKPELNRILSQRTTRLPVHV